MIVEAFIAPGMEFLLSFVFNAQYSPILFFSSRRIKPCACAALWLAHLWHQRGTSAAQRALAVAPVPVVSSTP